jgi:hypothetical protein
MIERAIYLLNLCLGVSCRRAMKIFVEANTVLKDLRKALIGGQPDGVALAA